VKIVKIIGIVLLVYVGIVVLFESLIGYFQPGGDSTLVITTTGADGVPNDRVLAKMELDGQLYVAANHWPRAWYTEAVDNPNVQVTVAGQQPAAYLAVSLTGEESERVDAEYSLGPIIKILTGFPPRRIMRLDPA